MRGAQHKESPDGNLADQFSFGQALKAWGQDGNMDSLFRQSSAKPPGRELQSSNDQLKTANQKLSICGRCHADYTYKGQPFAPDFRPGDDLIKDPDFKLAEVTKPADFQQLNDFMHSKHAQNDITCITCHAAGKNFPGIASSSVLFGVMLALMVAIPVSMIWYFKYRDWL